MNQLLVMMTGDESMDGSVPSREVRDREPGPMEDPISLMYPHQKRLGCCNLSTPHQK